MTVKRPEKGNKLISASMMCADIFELKDTVDSLRDGGVGYLHVDVMDGEFVPNLMLGTDFVRQLHGHGLPLDIHLMIKEPERKLSWFSFGEGDIVSVHIESTVHLQRTLAEIHGRKAYAFAALNPATPPETLKYVLQDIDGVLLMTVNPGYAGQKLIPGMIEKIKDTRRFLDDCGCGVPIEVDGNISFENAAKMSNAGADIFVAGSSGLFMKGETLSVCIEKLRKAIH